jgi:hypothetical protein
MSRTPSSAALFLLAALVPACGGKPAPAKPKAQGHGSRLAELVAAGQKYPVPALTGEVTCYEATMTMQLKDGTEGPGAEVYLRRAVDAATGSFVEDSVQIAPGAAPMRFVTTYAPTAEPGWFDVTEALEHWSGKMLRDESSDRVVQGLSGGAFVFTTYEPDPAGLRQTSVIYTAGAVPEMKTVDDFFTILSSDGGVAQLVAKASFRNVALLRRMTPDACASAFSYFPPATKYF